MEAKLDLSLVCCIIASIAMAWANYRQRQALGYATAGQTNGNSQRTKGLIAPGIFLILFASSPLAATLDERLLILSLTAVIYLVSCRGLQSNEAGAWSNKRIKKIIFTLIIASAVILAMTPTPLAVCILLFASLQSLEQSNWIRNQILKELQDTRGLKEKALSHLATVHNQKIASSSDNFRQAG